MIEVMIEVIFVVSLKLKLSLLLALAKEKILKGIQFSLQPLRFLVFQGGKQHMQRVVSLILRQFYM